MLLIKSGFKSRLSYSVPLSVFGDVNLLLELFDNPFSFYWQGGVGIRYNLQ